MSEMLKNGEARSIEVKTSSAIVNGMGEYYLWQPDKQNALSRNARQSKIFNEYFVVRNVATEKKAQAVLVFGLSTALVGAILAVIGVVLGMMVLAIVGGIVFAVGGICIYVYSTNKRTVFGPARIMSDEEYEREVNAQISEMDIQSSAKKRFGLKDEDIIGEPIIITSKARTGISLENYTPTSGATHYSTYQTVVLFSTADKLCMYKIIFDMCCDQRSELTSEFTKYGICDIQSEITTERVSVLVYSMNATTAKLTIVSMNSQFSIILDTDKDIQDQIDRISELIKGPNIEQKDAIRG